MVLAWLLLVALPRTCGSIIDAGQEAQTVDLR